MWYIGSRTKIGCHPDDGYICSSKIVNPMIIANPADWYREILEIGTSPAQTRFRETEILTEINARAHLMSYNQTNGDGQFSFAGFRHTAESKLLIKENQPDKSGDKNPCYGRVGVKHPMYGHVWDAETNERRREKCKKIIQTPDQKKKNAESQIGRRWVTNGTESKRITTTDSIPEGWRIGQTSQHAEKISQSMIGEAHWNHGNTTSDETKKKIAQSLIGHEESVETKNKKKASSQHRPKILCVGCSKMYLSCHSRHHAECAAK